jgi:hypothetical protein
LEGNAVSDGGLSAPTGFSAGPKRGDLLLETDLIRLDVPAAADNSPPPPDPAAPTATGEYADRKGLVRMISKHCPLIVCPRSIENRNSTSLRLCARFKDS